MRGNINNKHDKCLSSVEEQIFKPKSINRQRADDLGEREGEQRWKGEVGKEGK